MTAMADRLGASFVTCALGAVHYAGSCLLASQVHEGLNELAPDALRLGLQRGIDQIATQAGVSAADVATLLPMGELDETLAAVTASQSAAMRAWELHAGHIGGMLQGVAELTVDGRAPDASLCLERLADKLRRDKAISEPLRELARDVGRFQDLVATCRARLEEGGALARAYRRRRLRRIATASVVLLVSATALVGGWLVRGAGQRVDAALEADDPCAALSVDEGDLRWALGDRPTRVAERRTACKLSREVAARELEARRLLEERDRETMRLRDAELARCATLADALSARRLGPEEEAFAGESRALLRRLVDRELRAADYGPNPPALPCSEGVSGKRVAAAYVEAAVSTPWFQMPELRTPSKWLRESFAEHAALIPVRSRNLFSMRAEAAAKGAIRTGFPDEITKATGLCELSLSLGVAKGGSCTAVLSLASPASVAAR